GRLRQQELPLSTDKGGAEPEIIAKIPRRKTPHAWYRGMPALPSGDRDWRHLGRDEFEDGQARQLPLSRRAAGGREPLRAGLSRPRFRARGSGTDPWTRDRRAVWRQVFLPRCARDPAAAAWREPADRDRRLVLGGSPDPRQDHRGWGVSRRARNRPGAISPWHRRLDARRRSDPD